MAEELDEMSDYLRVGCTVHPDTQEQYRACMTCYEGECQSCELLVKKGLSEALARFFKPRMPFPSM